MLAGPALSAFAIFHSSECADVVNVPGGNGAVAEEKVFCQGCRGDHDEPDHGKKGTLDHENLLIPARRVLASLRVNVGPLGFRETAARCRIRSPTMHLISGSVFELLKNPMLGDWLEEDWSRAN